MEIERTVITILEEVTEQKIDYRDAMNSQKLIEDFGLNSLNLMYFIVSLEDRLGITIDLSEIELSLFSSVKSIVGYAISQKGNELL